MFVSNVGGIIAAASKESAHPLRKTGKIPAIKRIVLSMQQAGLFPIVVVVGADDYESRYQLNNLNVVFFNFRRVGRKERTISFGKSWSFLFTG